LVALLFEHDGHARSSAFADCEVKDTTWGTQEFSRYDPDRNSLVFYRDS
jgi:hypothetical protein